MYEHEVSLNIEKIQQNLKIDCEQCSGLCCVALYCMKTDGFPANKKAGVPCKHLKLDFRCEIHSILKSNNMRGCLAYDCFGAGQKVTRYIYPKIDWQSNPDKAHEIFQVFLIVFQLHQMEWYLLESLSLISEDDLIMDIRRLLSENEQMTSQSTCEILKLDIDAYRVKVNHVLKKLCESIVIYSHNETAKDFFGKHFKKECLRGKDFSMSLMIAADLEGCDLFRANFLGADMRDANIKNADLSECVFLTQRQINAAKGNIHTKLPRHLSYPSSW